LDNKKIQIEFQHFDGCPNSPKLWKNLAKAIAGLEDRIEMSIINIDTPEKAMQYRFRGSPSLLINGSDFENAPEPQVFALSCRYYPNGLPPIDLIRDKIIKLLE